jgi:hypothetical protein
MIIVIFIDDRCLINEENPDNDQIFAFLSMFYSNFVYMIQTLTLVRKEKKLIYSLNSFYFL